MPIVNIQLEHESVEILLPDWAFDAKHRQSSAPNPTARFNPSPTGQAQWRTSLTPSSAPTKKNLIIGANHFTSQLSKKEFNLYLDWLTSLGFNVYLTVDRGGPHFIKCSQGNNLLPEPFNLARFNEKRDFEHLADKCSISKDSCVLLTAQKHRELDRARPFFLTQSTGNPIKTLVLNPGHPETNIAVRLTRQPRKRNRTTLFHTHLRQQVKLKHISGTFAKINSLTELTLEYTILYFNSPDIMKKYPSLSNITIDQLKSMIKKTIGNSKYPSETRLQFIQIIEKYLFISNPHFKSKYKKACNAIRSENSFTYDNQQELDIFQELFPSLPAEHNFEINYHPDPRIEVNQKIFSDLHFLIDPIKDPGIAKLLMPESTNAQLEHYEQLMNKLHSVSGNPRPFGIEHVLRFITHKLVDIIIESPDLMQAMRGNDILTIIKCNTISAGKLAMAYPNKFYAELNSALSRTNDIQLWQILESAVLLHEKECIKSLLLFNEESIVRIFNVANKNKQNTMFSWLRWHKPRLFFEVFSKHPDAIKTKENRKFWLRSISSIAKTKSALSQLVARHQTGFTRAYKNLQP